jgi:CxxC motif-containing protein (DUF1111 family)
MNVQWSLLDGFSQNGLRITAPFVTALSFAVVLAATRTSTVQAEDRVQLGRELFEHQWVKDDPLSPDGDGLGPMYNADSCFACHSLGGMGGSGSAEHNVSLLSVAVANVNPTARERTAIRSHAGKIHPAFAAGPNAVASLVLHRFSSEPRYERWRLGVLGFERPAQAAPSRAVVAFLAAEKSGASLPSIVDLWRHNGFSLKFSQRNTPALFGARLVDSISDETLLELAKEQSQKFPGIEGRVGRTVDGKVARFGWRGQSASLRDFVLTACAVELGLENKGHPQAANPLERHKAKTGNDLTLEQCDALIAYVASLPSPRQIVPAIESELSRMKHGEKLFESSGCVACHVRDVGDVAGIYSDLLLHDMGAGLEDPIPAFPDREGRPGSASGNSAYYGGPGDFFVDVPPRLRREWRTPALWGVRDSAPYLHDGRARTLTEAIAAHGGEAEPSLRKFKGLNYLERSHLLEFLNSLSAPDLRQIASTE